MATAYECPECGWQGTIDGMGEIPSDARPHIRPGELHPAGFCPQCLTLIEVADEDVPDYTLFHVARIMRQRGWIVREEGGLDDG